MRVFFERELYKITNASTPSHMAESFSFSDSLLFAPTQELGLEEPLVFAADQDLPHSPSLSAALPAQLSPEPSDLLYPPEELSGKEKEVRLFNGTSLRLRPRKKKNVDISFDESSSILDMDTLYERVRQREVLRQSREEIRRRTQPKPSKSSQALLPQVWSEKYRPTKYMQLCSAGNERQYRAIMHWLRKWGLVVFGHAPTDLDAVDHLSRPLRKVLLVHGPLGTGKTAAVHLIAQQMGYSVQELNAANSMDSMHGVESLDNAGRFANATAALKLKIKNALTTNSVTGGGKPTCLVIDEIDCSINAGDIIRVISELVALDLRSEDPKKKKSKFVLNRPIICIANDIYTQNVRLGPNPMDKLRPLCELVPFRRPVSSNNSGRINIAAQKSVKEFLQNVNSKEKMGLDAKEIAEIFEVCEGDIRACLNHMQFSSRKLDSDLHALAGPKALAAKDSLVSWFALVDQIFRRDSRMAKDENFEVMLEIMLSNEGKTAASGSLDKVIRGCFNRYLDVVHVQDDSNVRPAEISDWLYYYDMMTAGNKEVGNYPTLTALKFWSLFSEINAYKWKTENSLLPNARAVEFDSLDTLKQNKSVVQRVSDQLPVEVRLAFCGSSSSPELYACQFLPFLDKMLSPEVGSSKIKTSLKSHERRLVESLAGITKKLGLALETQRDIETNATSLVFSPNWDTLTIFENELAPVPFTTKARGILQKRLWLFPLLEAEFALGISTKRTLKDVSASELNTVKAKRARMASSLDFFKNRYDHLNSQLDVAPKTVKHSVSRIWVKHHEGYSNAVRKNIGWQDLWVP